jgi:WD40 repeat protein
MQAIQIVGGGSKPNAH